MDERVGDQFGRCALIVAFGKQARDQPDHHGVRLTAFAALALFFFKQKTAYEILA